MSTWRVECGDCLELLKSLPSGSVDAVVTDPPYSSGGMVRGDRMNTTRNKYQSTEVVKEFEDFTGDNRDQRGFLVWSTMWLGECRRILKPGGMVCAFTDWRQLPTLTDAFQCGGLVWRGIAVWDKVMARPMPGRFRAQAEYIVWGTSGPRNFDTADGAEYADGVLRIVTTPTSEREHSTQKPVELMEKIIRIAAPSGGTVLDPFTGSGATGEACVRNGRNFIGFELSEHYHEVASRRIGAAVPLWSPPTKAIQTDAVPLFAEVPA